MKSKTIVSLAIVAVAAFIAWKWYKSRPATVAAPDKPVAGNNPGSVAPPTLSQTGIADIFVGNLPGLNF